MDAALQKILQEKLAYLLGEQAKNADPDRGFQLQKKIEEVQKQLGLLSTAALKEDISRLPKPSTNLVGRNEELEKLTMSLKEKNKNITYICAAGGIGKSALTFQWLKTMQPDYCNVEKVFAWSFYSQGSHDTQNSSTAFFQEALPFFGFNGEIPKDDTAKGRLLVKYLNNQSFILILDGLEPLQHRVNILDGELKDVGIRALIDDLFYHGLKTEKSLVLISSRQPLAELESWDEEKYLKIDLQTLNKKEGAILLKKLGVKGTTEGLEQEELEQTSEEWGGHALALVLLGKLLKNKFVGKVRFRNRLPALWTEDRLGGHALRILKFYEQQWSNNNHEYIFMALMSLFDRPMGISEKQILVEKAEIATPLRNLDEIAWEQLEITLESSGLLLSCDSYRTHWDCHPLIREYFCEQFKQQHFNLFQQAHLMLFEFYQHLPDKYQPNTLEELVPLYRAVVHGCLAGEYKKALHNVYEERIVRWENKEKGLHRFYSQHKLGLYSEDLSVLVAFFPQGWSQPIQQGLSKVTQAWLLGTSAYCLMSLGRLAEAIEPTRAAVNIFVKIKDWKNASRTAQNLVDLMLPYGQLTEAVTAAQQAIDYAKKYAKKSENLFEQITSYSLLGEILHDLGKLEESKNNFEQAERLVKQWSSMYPQLYSTDGFQYCALLIDQATNKNDLKMIVKRGEYSLEIGISNNYLLMISLDQLTLAHAYFKLGELKKAESYFNQAVEASRKAGTTHYLPMFLLDRSNFLIKINTLEEAKRDLEEAKQIIFRSGTKLYEVDYHLAMCNYIIKTNTYKSTASNSQDRASEQENTYKSITSSSHARAWELGERGSSLVWELEEKRSFDKHLSAAKTLIKSTGYHLRDKSILELEKLM